MGSSLGEERQADLGRAAVGLREAYRRCSRLGRLGVLALLFRGARGDEL